MLKWLRTERFSLGVAALALAVLFFRAGGHDLAGGMGVALIGGTLFFAPRATPQTVEIMGKRRAYQLVRVLGGLIFVLGVTIAASAVL